MKALSVRAPWWWAILHGKPVENRDWYTFQRGRIYLHASKWWGVYDVAYDVDDMGKMAKLDGIDMPTFDIDEMKAAGGCLVGTVEIVDCITWNSIDSAFFVGDFGFVLKNPVALANPIPFKGALGFFNVPDEAVRGAKL